MRRLTILLLLSFTPAALADTRPSGIAGTSIHIHCGDLTSTRLAASDIRRPDDTKYVGVHLCALIPSLPAPLPGSQWSDSTNCTGIHPCVPSPSLPAPLPDVQWPGSTKCIGSHCGDIPFPSPQRIDIPTLRRVGLLRAW